MEHLKHELVNGDSVFVGTSVEIIKQLRDQAYFERGMPVDGYLTALTRSISESAEVNIKIPEGDVESRAEAFVQELIRLGYFKEA